MKFTKRYGDALAQVFSSQPDEVTDLPFRGVEEQLKKLSIPDKYRSTCRHEHVWNRMYVMIMKKAVLA